MSKTRHRTLYLVACVARKSADAAPARELYQSSWFSRARRFVESQRGRWMILSAEHGLLSPDTIVSPYDTTLNRMSAADRKTWADRVLRQIDDLELDVERVVILAGTRYRADLERPLAERFAYVEVPMRGMGIGKQLQWLERNTR